MPSELKSLATYTLFYEELDARPATKKATKSKTRTRQSSAPRRRSR